MPILSDDIKILQSAVMADVAEGGGAITGTEITDGASNEIFPDLSADDASGRVQLRKVAGMAHTADTDTLLGANFVLLDQPADPLVSVALFETPGWADERTTAQELVERYLVKGPRLTCRLLDTHYAGSILVQLYQVGGADFPAPGDAIDLRNPDGQEQYVRVTKVTQSTGSFNATEGGGTVTFTANLAVCEVGQPLAFDVLGPPVGRVINEAVYAQVYRTAASEGARFYGVKPLDVDAQVGDRTVYVPEIYAPLVPAATVEEPLTDIAPLTARQSLGRTAHGLLTLPAETLTLTAGAVLRTPTAIEPGSFTMTRGATIFIDDSAGVLKQGTTAVGAVDYRGKTITMDAGSPGYGSASTVIAYKPATPSGAAVHSREIVITTANQGLGFTAAFEPPPAPGTLTISYMAQDRWYALEDNGAGKLSGADSSYGTGSLSYSTGSAAFTLGALPDAGSSIIYQWGDAASAVAVDAGDLPTRLEAVYSLATNAIPDTVALTWSRGGTEYMATMDAEGILSGDATGGLSEGGLRFAPAVLPDGLVDVAFDSKAFQSTNATHSGGGVYQLELFPVVPGRVRLTVLLQPQSGFGIPTALYVGDFGGSGLLTCHAPEAANAVFGTVNYTTGVVTVNATVAMTVNEYVVQSYPSGSNTLYFEKRVLRNAHTVDVANTSVTGIAHTSSTGGATGTSASFTPTWGLAVPILSDLSLSTDSLAFSVGGTPYTAQAGALTAGWSAVTGSGAPAGSVSSGGAVTVTNLPASGANSVTWSNAAQSKQVGKVGQGVFRVEAAPIKTGVFQIQVGALVGSANDSGVITGAGWAGSVDFQRGIVRWNRMVGFTGGYGNWVATNPVSADELTYNAVFLQYLPLDGTLLGLETARLPLDGRVPIYRAGGQVLVHNTQTYNLPNPLVKGEVYSLGRERIGAAVVRTVTGARVSGTKFNVDFDAGTIVFPVDADLTGLAQPFAVAHRIEDEIMVLRADLSGKIDLVFGLTHDYPAGTSFVSSKMRKGDLFARVFGYHERTTWAGGWEATLAGAATTAQYNSADYPITTTNRGAIPERWALIFQSATTVRVVGESVGQVLTGVSINAPIAPINPTTGVPYFTVPELGWGGGWAVGNVLLIETAACGATTWICRTVLPGPRTVASDKFTLAFRGDVDAT